MSDEESIDFSSELDFDSDYSKQNNSKKEEEEESELDISGTSDEEESENNSVIRSSSRRKKLTVESDEEEQVELERNKRKQPVQQKQQPIKLKIPAKSNLPKNTTPSKRTRRQAQESDEEEEEEQAEEIAKERLTKRQRTLYYDEQDSSLLKGIDEDLFPKKDNKNDDLLRIEKAKKRKLQSEQKLEQVKQQTIEKLLRAKNSNNGAEVVKGKKGRKPKKPVSSNSTPVTLDSPTIIAKNVESLKDNQIRFVDSQKFPFCFLVVPKESDLFCCFRTAEKGGLKNCEGCGKPSKYWTSTNKRSCSLICTNKLL